MVVGTMLTTFATNKINISTSSGEPGNHINIDVGLENDSEAVVVDLLIPLVDKQLTYVDGSCTLNSERINGHQVQAAETDEGLRIVVYSVSLNPFVGNSGQLLSFKLKLGKDPQRYPLECRAIVGDANGNSLETSTTAGEVTILAPELTILTPEIDFGHIPIRSDYSASVRIKNTGTTDLELNDYIFSAAEFTAKSTIFTLHPDQTQNIEINYHPITRGAVSETMQIASNAVNGIQKVGLVADPFSVNELHVGKVSGISDEEVTISLTMNNLEPIVGMQCSFMLPEELEYVENSFSTTVRSSGLTPTATLRGNELTLILYSINNAEISGNDGEIATFKLRLNGRTGYYYLYPRNVILSNLSIENMVSATSNGYVHIQSPKLSCSSELDMGHSPITEPAEAKFSLYNDSNIPLTIEKVAFLSEGYSSEDQFPIVIGGRETYELSVRYLPQIRGKHSTTMNIYSNDPNNRMKSVTVKGEIYEPNNLSVRSEADPDGCNMIISLDNYTDIVALQMDISWLSSMSTDATKLQLSDRLAGLSATISDFGSGVYRVIIYSLNNTSISGNEGEIFRLKYIGSDYVNTELKVSNIVISNSTSVNMASQTELTYQVPPTLAESITLNETEITLKATDKATLTATVLPELTTDKSVIWTSSNESVAEVDTNGVVTAIAVGEATITATTTDGTNLSATCKVVVEPTLAESITLNETEITLLSDEMFALQAIVVPNTATNKKVEWQSLNEEVAVIDQNGIVTAIGRGTTIITATTLDGTNLSAKCKVTVKAMTAPVKGVVESGVNGYINYNEAVHTWAETFSFTVYTSENNNAAFTAELSSLPSSFTSIEAIVNESHISELVSEDNKYFKGQTYEEYADHSIIRFKFRITYGTISIETETFEYQIAGDSLVKIENIVTADFYVKVEGNDIVVCKAPVGSQIFVYSINGQQIAAKEVTDTNTSITAQIKGVYLVKVGTNTCKVFVK